MNASPFVTLQDGTGASAVVAPHLGAWLLRYSQVMPDHGPVEALHFSSAVVDRYPREMYAGNPLLFPLVSFNHLPGRDHHYGWQGRVFPMPQHGLARHCPWAVRARSPSSVVMELCDTEATRSQYPFAFRHGLTYRLDQGRLAWDQEIENRSSEPMPFASGFHPYFAVPLTPRGERSRCYVRLPDSTRLWMHGRGERFTPEPFAAQNWSVAEDVAPTMFLTELRRPEVTLVDPGSELEVGLNWGGAPAYRFVAIWARSTAEPFYCLEPWTALSNAFTRSEANELLQLAPGEVFRASFWMELRRAA